MIRNVTNKSNQKRVDCIATLGVVMAIALLTLPIPLTARAQATYEFRMAHVEGIGIPITDAFEKWGKILKERSGGRIVAKHFPAGQLGNYTQLIEGCRMGTIQATAGGPDTEEAVAPEIAVPCMGFIFEDEAHADRVLQGEIGREISEIARQKTGVSFLDYGEVGFRHLLSKRPVRNLSELKGLKLRCPELKVWIDFWRALGANPTPLPYVEQYSALSTGVIEGLDSDFFSIKSFKFHEQAKYLSMTYHWFLPKAIRVNARWLDGLPTDLQKLVHDTAREVFSEQRRINRANTGKALEELKKEGVVVLQITDLAQWHAITASQQEEFFRKYPKAAQMMAKIKALK